MSCIVSKAFILFVDARDKRFTSHVIFCNTVVKIHKERQYLHVFGVKMVDICKKISLFSIFALYASDNLVHILLQLKTFHAHYTNHKD